MTESSPEPEKKPARPLNRWGIGSIAMLQTALLALILISLNYLADSHYLRKDMSRGGDYSLSSSTRTRNYLAALSKQDRGRPVKWIMAFRRSSPFYDRVRKLAEEYARLSGGKITLENVDPLRSPDRMQEVCAAYGITLVRDLMIIDARKDESPAISEGADKTKALNPHVRLIAADDMAVYTIADGKRKISGFLGEDVLTARLVESIEGKPRKMALLTDKSRADADGAASPRKSLENILRFQNVELTDTRLSDLEDIPEDIAGVVIAAPKYDFSDEEIAVLERYWTKPRTAIFVLIDSGETPPKLRAFLRGNGVTPRKDRIVARDKDKLITAARGFFTNGVGFLKDLAGQATEFGGASSSLEVREGADDLINRRINAVGLIQVADGFWGETKFGQGNEAFDEREDNKPPIHIAACVARGAESDDRFAADSSRMIVVSNTDFMEPKHQSAENLDFLSSSVNWLVGREALVGIGPRSLGTYKLPLLDAQVSFINRVNLFFIPVALVLAGAFVWSSRRV